MCRQSSGCYVIDSEYNIVNANETALRIYPQLKVGKKCYACLMGLDGPCGPCPVVRGVKGPTTYTDPIRNISEIVDAVDIEIPGHGPCHMLIFSTVENEAQFAATLPTSAEELKNLALIKGLTADYYDVFSVKIDDGSMILYRLKGKPLSPDSIYLGTLPYADQMENYIRKYVVEEDQAMMRASCDLSAITAALRSSESMVLHYRIRLDHEIHYYYRKIVRIGDADAFENIVVGIGCEDEAVENREKQLALQQTLRKVELNTATGLLNQEAFFIYGDKLILNRQDLSFDFCFLKIDNLLSITHQYGPIVRDQVIQAVGDVLRMYINDTTCTAYFGEGLFACFVQSQDTEAYQAVIHAFEEQALAKCSIKNLVFKWSVYKQMRRDMLTRDTYSRISYILNTMRGSIPQNYIELDQPFLERFDWNLSVERSFHKALENGEFKVWFQPKYAVDTQNIIGAEALVRWITADGTIIPPNRFIPILENSGQINLLDEEVFRQVCRFQKSCADHGLPQIPISVNLSRASIFINDIPKRYASIAAACGVPVKLIPIEITESAAVRSTMIGEFADALIRRGFSLHMDDFGSGYSSLASLQTLPFECIKIDKSLVDFIGNPSGESLLRHTIAFAKETGLHIVAEGVEYPAQFDFLKKAGCDSIQGYYFSKPVSLSAFTDMLKEGNQNPIHRSVYNEQTD